VKGSRLEIGHVNIRMQGGRWTPQQAEKIARSMVQQMRETLARRQDGARSGARIERLAPRPVRIGSGTTGEEIARAAAAEICRALGEH
jgi:hypothetical protein